MEETKYRFGLVRQVTEEQKENRIVDFVISDDSKDRHDTVLNMSNWELNPFNENGIVGYQHNVYGGGFCNEPNPDSVIGKGSAFLEGDKLIGRVVFEPKEINELADKIFQKVLFGSLKATSVGFIPLKDKEGKTGTQGRPDEHGKIIDTDTFFFHGQELLEWSIVNIPANANALKRTIREQTHGALLFIREQLGGDYSFADIGQLKIEDVLNLLDGKGVDKKELEKIEDGLEFYHESLERDISIKKKKAGMAVL